MPGTFHLEITGDPLEKDSIDKFTTRLIPRLQTFSPGYTLNVYNFMGISFRIVIKGIPLQFDYLDNLISSLKLYINKYLRNWTYTMKVNYVERER